MAKKLKKAILAGLTAYAASKMMGKGSLKGNKYLSTDRILDKVPKEPLVDAISGGTKFKPDVLGGASTRGRDPTWWEKWFHGGRTQKKAGGAISATVWKKHGGAIRTEHARMGKMIKAAQGTYAKEDESLGMRLGKGKGTAKERDMSYGDWGKRKTDWAKSGKMIKAAHGTEVRTMGSNPFTPKGSVVGVKTKLNGTVKTRVF